MANLTAALFAIAVVFGITIVGVEISYHIIVWLERYRARRNARRF